MAGRPKQLNVFVSSTFTDLVDDRIALSSHVFPEIRAECARRGDVFADIDLRWGVTEEQKAEGQVLARCLAEIDRARPYIIVLLGDRYGWVPEEIAEDLLHQYPWLRECQGCSVTEIEIIHGALRRELTDLRPLFYFRRKHPDARVPDGEASRVASLKERILRAHAEGRFPTAPQEYDDPSELVELVKKDLTKLVVRDFPEGQRSDGLEAESEQQAAFAVTRATHFVGRQEQLAILERHIDAKNGPLLLIGQAGAGKTSILAALSRRLRSRPATQRILVVDHYVGGSEDGTKWRMLVARILRELERTLDVRVAELPREDYAVQEALARRLRAIAERSDNIVVVLDGLHKLDDEGPALDLGWLPFDLPENVTLIVTADSGRPRVELERRGLATFEVPALREEERNQLTIEYLARHGKHLSSGHLQRIVSHPATENATYCRALLEELRLWGEHHSLGSILHTYLQTRTASDLYAAIFRRWERAYQATDETLVSDLLSLLFCSRRGLSQHQLRQLLGTQEALLPQARLTPILFAAGDLLAGPSGLLRLADDYARAAVERAYVSSADAERRSRRRLADYFLGQPPSSRAAEEIIWQLARLEDWTGLVDTLSRADLLEHLLPSARQEVGSLWARIESTTEKRMAEAYEPFVTGERNDELAFCVALVLSDAGHSEDSAVIARRMTAAARAAGDPLYLARCLNNEVQFMRELGRATEALVCIDEAIAIKAEIGDRREMVPALGNRALALKDLGRYADAHASHDRLQAICREDGLLVDLSISLTNQSKLLQQEGREDEAIEKLDEAAQLCRQLGQPHEQCDILCRKARIHRAKLRQDEALRAYSVAEGIQRELSDPRTYAIVAREKACLSHAPAEAQALLERAANLLERYGRPDEVMEAKGTRALAWCTAGRVGEAAPLLREIFEQRGNAVLELVVDLGWLANGRSRLGDFPTALAMFDQILDLLGERAKGKLRALLLRQRAEALRGLGKSDEALAALREALACLAPEDVARTATLSQYAKLLTDVGCAEAALEAGDELIILCRKHPDVHALCMALGDQANRLTADRITERAALYSEEAALWASIGDRYRQAMTMSLHAIALRNVGSYEDAVFLNRQEAEILRELGVWDELVKNLGDQFHHLSFLARVAEMNAVSREQVEILEQLGDSSSIPRTLERNAVRLLELNQIDSALKLAEEAARRYRELSDEPLARNVEYLIAELRGLAEASPLRVRVPSHSSDPDEESTRNVAYQRELSAWRALPLLRRLFTPRPRP